MLGSSDSDSTCSTMSREFRRALYDLRKQGALNDVTITVADDQKFQAHRIILASSSGYFRALFTTQVGKKFECYLPQISPEIMSQLLEYIYLRILDVNQYNAMKIFHAADYLAIDGACNICCNFFVTQLNPKICIPLYIFAKLYYLKLLIEKSWEFIMYHFQNVLQHKDELISIGKDDLIQILKSDSLNVRSEEKVWDSVVLWTEAKPEREKDLVTLLQCVRMGLLSSKYFIENIRYHRLIKDNDECRPTIINALRLLFDLEIVEEDVPDNLSVELSLPRLPHHVVFAVGGWSYGSPVNTIEIYDVRADRWIRMLNAGDPSGPRAYHGTAAVGQDLYVIGGYNGLDYFNSCRCFNVISSTWREISAMNRCRCYVSTAVLGDYIYAIGGFNGSRRQNTAERYDIKSNQWNMIARMSKARSDAAAATLNGKIYVVGGFDGHECLNSAEEYDPETGMWNLIEAMASPRSGVSCAVYDDQVYVMGGFNGSQRLSTGERYNPKLRLWREVPRMVHSRSNFSLAVIEDTLMAIGGFNGMTTTSDVESYSKDSNVWCVSGSLQVSRSALSSCVMFGLPTALIADICKAREGYELFDDALLQIEVGSLSSVEEEA